MLMVGGAALALLVSLLALMRLKKKPEDDLNEFALDDDNEDLFDLDDSKVDDGSDLDDAAYEEDNTFSLDDDLDESVQAQTEDVVAEADIYVSLGQEDKAIELLQKEIQQNPDNADARLGLLKIYAKSQNSEGFDEQYAQLLPLGNVYANDQAMALRKEIENAEPFDTDQYSLKDDGLDFLDEIEADDLDLDMDLDVDEAAKSLKDGGMAFSETESDLGGDELSLDLDDVSDNSKDNNDKAKTESSDTDFSLDFDDLDDLDDIDDLDDLSKDKSKDLAASSDLDEDLEDIEFSLDLDDGDENESEDISLDLDSDLEDDSLDDMEFDLDLDLNDDLDASLSANEKSNASTKDGGHSLDDLDEDDDFSLELDDLDDNLEASLAASDINSEEDLDDDLENDFDLELDELDDDLKAASKSTDTEIDDKLTDELDDDLEDDFNLELDDLDENVKTSSEKTIAADDSEDDFDLGLDELDYSSETSSKFMADDSGDGLDNDISMELDGDFLDLEEDGSSDNKKSSKSLTEDDIESLDIDADDIESAKSEIDADDSLDLDSPPPMDVDMASLDEEIDAMTSGMDDSAAEAIDIAEQDEAEELEPINSVEDKAKPSDLDINDANEDKVVSADDELDFLEESDEVSTKLDLAKAYMDMGDREGAEDILNEVMEEGNEQQKSDAKLLMENL
jgi:pilus assembly protein FimV